MHNVRATLVAHALATRPMADHSCSLYHTRHFSPDLVPTYPRVWRHQITCRSGPILRILCHPSSQAPSMVELPLLPHLIPNPTPLSGGGFLSNTDAQRPWTPSIDSMYAAVQLPSKRSRGSLEDQRGRVPRSSYSDTVSLKNPPL